MHREMSENSKKPVRRQRKLLFQIGIILVPLFLLMLVLVTQTVYRSTVEGYLRAQKRLMRDHLSLAYENSFYYKEELPEDELWFLDYWAANPDILNQPYTPEEEAAFEELAFDEDWWTLEWFDRIPPEVQRYCAKSRAESLTHSLNLTEEEYDSGDLFIMDVNDPYEGFIYASSSRNDQTLPVGECLPYSLSDHPALRSLLSHPSNRIEFETVQNFPQKGSYYIAYKPLFDNGKIRAVMALAYSWGGMRHAMSDVLGKAFLVGIGGLIISLLILLFLLYRRAIAPVKKIQQGIQDYIRTKDSAAVTDSLSRIRERNEIGLLSEDLSMMVQEIDHYTAENVRMAEDRKRVETELTLAAKIQAAMLPKDFPVHESFSLSASMTPAKEVGGDFYDFFFLDEGHLVLVIADVSGKGIPAALFMMMCKNMIKNYAKEGLSPSRILDRTNRAILENDENSMFVTVWIGICELSTGHFTAANAGHEYPMLRKATGGFELFKDRHSLVVGAMEDIELFREYEFDLERGGTLFLYTDGATEATNSSEELFGTERMLSALNREPDSSPEDLIRNMKAAISEFVGDAPQFDDLTMLVIRRK